MKFFVGPALIGLSVALSSNPGWSTSIVAVWCYLVGYVDAKNILRRT